MKIGSLVRACIVCAIVLQSNGFAGPTITVGTQVGAAQRISAERIDHKPWDVLLKKYVNDSGMVDYRAWKANAADMNLLNQYLLHLSSASFSGQTSEPVKLAYWINAYNVVTVYGILKEYPTTSIRNHTAKVFGYNIWQDLHLLVEGNPYSLDQMEHEVLRPLGEPRIHFAIVCASIGCPRLLNEAYLPERIDDQLTINAKAFFTDPTKFRSDVARNSIELSPILDWYGGDFGKSMPEKLRRLAPYLPEGAQQLAQNGKASVSFLGYDWNLNDQAKVRR